MNKDIFDGAVEWQPELAPEDQARAEELRQRWSSAASLFRKARKELGLSQVEAAARLATTQANISKIEKRVSADVGQLEKLAADSDYEVLVVLRRKDGQREVVLT